MGYKLRNLDNIIDDRIITPIHIIEITPTIAAIWLKERNSGNRKLRPSRVAYFTKQIQEGVFAVTNTAIAFDNNGILIDGQHRLQACVNVNKSIYSYVISKMNPNAYGIIDSHARRSLSDSSRIEPNRAMLIKACLELGKGISPVTAAIAQDHEKLLSDALDALTPIRPHSTGTGQRAVWGAFVYAYNKSPEKIVAFANDFASAICQIEQAQLLKNFLFQHKHRAGGQFRQDIFQRTLYCVYCYLTGQKITRTQKMTPKVFDQNI